MLLGTDFISVELSKNSVQSRNKSKTFEFDRDLILFFLDKCHYNKN